MGRTEDGPTEPYIQPSRASHPAPPTPTQVTAEVFPEQDPDDPSAHVEEAPAAWMASQPAGTNCDSILDLDAWLTCEMAKRELPAPAPPPHVPPPPPPPTIGSDPALQDCDSITGDLAAWLEIAADAGIDCFLF